jgi:hypothetical protein
LHGNPYAVKFYWVVELMALLADREWLDEATKSIDEDDWAIPAEKECPAKMV